MAIAEITSKTQFTDKIKNKQRDQLLIFYGNNSQRLWIVRYTRFKKNEARILDVSPTKYDIYKINLDKVKLAAGDQEKYQLGNAVICCTTVNEGEVSERVVAPRESTLRSMVRNILT